MRLFNNVSPLTLLAMIVFVFSSFHIFHRIGWQPFLSRPSESEIASTLIDTAVDPLQTTVDLPVPISIDKNGLTYLLHRVASYSISGRIVSVEHYYPGGIMA